ETACTLAGDAARTVRLGRRDPILNIIDEDDDEFQRPGASTAPAPTAGGALEDVLGLLAPRQQKRARVLLHFAQLAGARADDRQRLLYPSGQVGSTLYELLTFAMLPPQMRKGRAEPIDYVDFMRLLERAQCPAHLFAHVEPSLLSSAPRPRKQQARMTSAANPALSGRWLTNPADRVLT